MQSSGAMGAQQYPLQLQLPYAGQSSGSMDRPQPQMLALEMPKPKRLSLSLRDKEIADNPNIIPMNEHEWFRAKLPTLQRQLEHRGISLDRISALKTRARLIELAQEQGFFS